MYLAKNNTDEPWTLLVALVLFQGKALSTSPAQKFEEVQTGVEDLVVLKHHFVKCVDWEVAVGVSVFECGHRGVKRVCLMTERGIIHSDDLESMLGGKTQNKHKPQVQTTRRSQLQCFNVKAIYDEPKNVCG